MNSNLKSFFLAILTISLLTACTEESSSEVENAPENGDLNTTFIEQDPVKELTAEQKFQLKKEKLIAEGWQDLGIENGPLPSCYNFSPQNGDVDNYLEVYVGSGTDVAIKVMNLNTEECIRYVFINSGTTYTIRNIPEGRYYLKIAYGKNWLSKVENGQCIGKFIRNPMYEKGEDIMDFNIQHFSEGFSIPSFKLQLDVVSTGISNSFSSQNISETEFNQ
jgi:hypothetical protein